MPRSNEVWFEHQRKRWMRPDAHRYWRPDAFRWMRPETLRLLGRPLGDQPQGKSDWHPQHDDSFDLRAERELLLRLKAEVTALLASLRLQRVFRDFKAYNPNQPRDDRGRWTDVGQWTRVAGPGGARSSRFGSNFPGARYDQLLRLDQAIGRTEQALAKVRQYDPNWQPRGESLSSPGSIEGTISRAEARAAEAEARIEQLRSGIGGNFGPPLGSNSRTEFGERPLRAFDGPAWINAYRVTNNMPDLLGHPTWPYDKGTVAVAELDGKLIFGVNSGAPTYFDSEWDAARRTRDIFIGRYPDVLDVENPGRRPNTSFFHAESTILFRAANENGGTLVGKTLEVHTDRDLCGSCQSVLPLLGSHLGNPTVTFTNYRTGETWLLQNGSVRKIK